METGAAATVIECEIAPESDQLEKTARAPAPKLAKGGVGFADMFTPKLMTVLREGYTLAHFKADAMAGLTVAIVALPLSMAIAIASGATPAQGLYTAAVGGFIVSLLGATFFLPMLLKGLEVPPETDNLAVEDSTRVLAAQAAIKAIEAAQHEMSVGQEDADVYVDTAVRLMDLYRERIQGRSQTGEAAELVRRSDYIEKKLRVAALRAPWAGPRVSLWTAIWL